MLPKKAGYFDDDLYFHRDIVIERKNMEHFVLLHEGEIKVIKATFFKIAE